MASLASTPWTDIDDTRVAVDAPVSTDLVTDIAVNANYLKAVLTDGASAPQDIVTSKIHLRGAGIALLVDNNAEVDGNMAVLGTLSTRVFYSSEQILFLMGF